ncbi:unnamed protein product [Meganyctiphanes norvegica]|uniref:C2H2-type domain-containing protein n=1 Tax=Meganyctiphanes norvegica TaxID=48144 RepID=A0AAV2RW54_MEGNR
MEQHNTISESNQNEDESITAIEIRELDADSVSISKDNITSVFRITTNKKTLPITRNGDRIEITQKENLQLCMKPQKLLAVSSGRCDANSEVRLIEERVDDVQSVCSDSDDIIIEESMNQDSNSSVTEIDAAKKVSIRQESLNIFTCVICGEVFKSDTRLKYHLMHHSDDKPFSCTICGLRFSQKTTLNVHVSTHVNKPISSCLYCDFATSSQFLMNKHRCNQRPKNMYISIPKEKLQRNQHTVFRPRRILPKPGHYPHTNGPVLGDNLNENVSAHSQEPVNNPESDVIFLEHEANHENLPTLKCDKCDFKTHYQVQLSAHKKENHDESQPFDLECNGDFNTLECDLRNDKIVREKENGQKDKVGDNLKGNASAPSQEPVNDPDSDVIFLEHETNHSDLPTLKCDQCDFKTLYQFNLSAHKKENHDESQPFDLECDGNFNSLEYDLRTDKIVRQKNNGQKDKWDLFQKLSTSDYIFLYDNKEHEKNKTQFECNACDFETNDNDILKIHKSVYQGVYKKYSCCLCIFKTHYLQRLKQHMLIHSGEKPHVCLFCDYRSRQHRRVVDHIRHNHTDLLKHILDRYNEQLCPLCDETITVKNYLKTHLQLKHKSIDNDKVISFINLYDVHLKS